MNKKQRKILYPTIFFLGLVLMAWQIIIFRNTIIDVSILIAIVLIIGLVAFLIDFKNYGKTYGCSGIWLYLYSLPYYICGYGFMVCSTFMLMNFYLADKEPIKKAFEIVERSSLPGRKHYRDERKPTFQIKYEGKIKELVFSNTYYKRMDFYIHVEMEVRKGYFGFDILENKNLK